MLDCADNFVLLYTCQNFRMQNIYSVPSNFFSLAPSNDLPRLDNDSSLNELFGEGSGFFCSPPHQNDFSDLSTVDIKEETPEEVPPPQLVPRSRATWKSKPYSLISQLKDLYHEEVRKNCAEIPEGSKTSYLLHKLVQRERYNLVIVTLNPIDEGFSVSFQLENGKTLEEEAKYPYTQDSLLDYIDKEQLPTPFLDYWEHFVPQLFYDGCVICQINDSRHGQPAVVSHVLLKPHTQSLISDVNRLLMDSETLWSLDEQFEIESDIINNTSRSLCLDPDPEVGRRIIKLQQDRHAFDNVAIRKLLYRSSPLLEYRKKKYRRPIPHSNPALGDFIAVKKARLARDKLNSILPDKSSRGDSNSDVKILRLLSSREILTEVCRHVKPLAVKTQHDTEEFHVLSSRSGT